MNRIRTDHPNSIEKNQFGFSHSVLKHISVLGLFEPSRAKRYYLDYIPKGFLIQEPTFGRFYRTVHNMFGFKIAQALYESYIFLRRKVT